MLFFTCFCFSRRKYKKQLQPGDFIYSENPVSHKVTADLPEIDEEKDAHFRKDQRSNMISTRFVGDEKNIFPWKSQRSVLKSSSSKVSKGFSYFSTSWMSLSSRKSDQDNSEQQGLTTSLKPLKRRRRNRKKSSLISVSMHYWKESDSKLTRKTLDEKVKNEQ